VADDLDAWHREVGGFADCPAFAECADRYREHFALQRCRVTGGHVSRPHQKRTMSRSQ
jgi:hypothetical protein